MIDFDPCGMVVSTLKFCYKTKIRLFADSDETVEVEYFFAPEGAKPLPFPHVFAPLRWEPDPWESVGLGEVYGEPNVFVPGKAPPCLTGQDWFGDQDKFLNGTTFDEDKEPTIRDHFGRVPDCFGMECEPIHCTGEAGDPVSVLPYGAYPIWCVGECSSPSAAVPYVVALVVGGSLLCTGGAGPPSAYVPYVTADVEGGALLCTGGADEPDHYPPYVTADVEGGDCLCTGECGAPFVPSAYDCDTFHATSAPQYHISVTGLTNLNCEDCVDWNTDWSLDPHDEIFPCLYFAEAGTVCGGQAYIYFFLDGTDWILEFNSAAGISASYQLTSPIPWDGTVSATFTLITDPGPNFDCDGWPDTFTIDPVP